MNGNFRCNYYHKIQNKLVKNNNQVCWAGLKNYDFLTPESEKAWRNQIFKLEEEIIYIDFSEKLKFVTKKNIDLLIKIINNITPCCLVQIDNKEYISFNLLKTYDQNLILLNFIRNIWYSPFTSYSEVFFEELKKSRLKDPLSKLTKANILACEKNPYPRSMGHSNVHDSDDLVICKTKDLLAYEGILTYNFLRGLKT